MLTLPVAAGRRRGDRILRWGAGHSGSLGGGLLSTAISWILWTLAWLVLGVAGFVYQRQSLAAIRLPDARWVPARAV